MRLEELLVELDNPRLSIVEHLDGDDTHGSETAGRYLSVDGHLWPEPAPWAEYGAERELIVGFVAHAVAMVEAWDAGLRTLAVDDGH